MADFDLRSRSMPWLMAATYDRCTAAVEAAGVAEWRRDLLADLAGDVLEIGAGTGHNLRWYPDSVQRLVLTEPDPHMRARLDAKRALVSGPAVVEIRPDAADHLDVADGSFDAVVSTLVLCSVPDPDAVLAEICRVLRPGGRFVYLEHVAATDRPGTLRWQRRLEPLWKRVAGNCHLTRSTGAAIAAAGFDVAGERREAMPKAPAIVRTTVRGAARNPS